MKAVLYDLGDIFFEAHLWRKWMYEYCFEKKLYAKTFADFYFLYEEYLRDVYAGGKEYQEAFKSFVADMKLGDSFIEESFSKKKYFEDTRVLYNGVKETLRLIKEKGLRNIIITDNEAPEGELRAKILKRFDIDHLIDKVVTSKETGVSKPDPFIFEHTLNLFGLKKDEAIFVGHDKDEVDGAVKFGLKTIEFNNYLNIASESNIKINTFSEILNYID